MFLYNGYVIHLSTTESGQCEVVSGATTNIDTATAASSEGDPLPSGMSQWTGRSSGQQNASGVVSNHNIKFLGAEATETTTGY